MRKLIILGYGSAIVPNREVPSVLMQLSTKSRYGLRAMIELALNYGQGPLGLKEIAKKHDLSDKYLDQVLTPLRTRGLLRTQKGSKGGYLLAVPPENVTAYDVIHAVEGSLAPVPCAENADFCDKEKTCATRDVWVRLQEVITGELKSITLAELVAEQAKRCSGTGQKKADQTTGNGP